MKKFWLVTLLATVFVLLQPATGSAAVNDFVITDFAIQYNLGRDATGRSTLETTETITALFPDIDQNHGLERALPNSYDGHSTSLKLQSVTDESGASLPYSINKTGSISVLRIGKADTYVHGSKTYVIRYTSRDVTKFFKDTGRDEFYWDTNGTGWQLPIQRLTVTLNLDESIAKSLTGDKACYQGFTGSTATCEITIDETATQYKVTATNLGAGENVTIALGFAASAFQPYQKTLFDKVFVWWVLWQFASGAVAFIVLLVLLQRASRRYRPKLEAIAPEFIPPKNTDIQTAALVSGRGVKMFSAQIIDLAVRHFLVIRLVKEKTLFSPAEYEIEIVKDPSLLLPEEYTFLSTLFGGDVTVGSRLNLKTLKNNTSIASTFQANRQKLVKSLSASGGYWEARDTDRALFKRSAGTAAVIGLLTLSIPLFSIVFVSMIIAFVLKSMTDKGIELSRYVAGLKLYVGAAEAEQLRMLQSPEGADKVGDLAAGGQKITLYERLLPYAVLFGLEKNWSTALGTMYEQAGQKPSWYDGGSSSALFNAAAFSHVMTNVSSAMSTYSASTGYSSSGGSSGGGSSGGGGGGGGGGGW